MPDTQPTLMTYKVAADIPNCCGYGLCASLCPEIYKLDEGGIIYLEVDTIPLELIDDAREGAEACPAGVITIESVEI